MLTKKKSSIAEPWDDFLSTIPFEEIESDPVRYGELTLPGTRNPVSNMGRDYLFFKDTKKLSPAAENFKKYGEYCPYIKGTQMWHEFWDNEWERCENGYEVDGFWISGEYYFYLNYCIISSVLDEQSGEPMLQFPLFLSMDYYWFMELYKAENPESGYARDKEHLIVAKSRRKGFSYKNAAGCLHKYLFSRKAKVVIASQRGEKARETFDMAMTMLDFINENTAFDTPWLIRKSSDANCRLVMGVKKKDVRTGKTFTYGTKNEILTVSLHNKPDGAAGLGAVRVIFEEAGMIRDLKEAWEFTEPTLRSGAIKKGIAVIYGTGGDMEGATQDFSEMWNNPKGYNLKAYKNIYEYEETERESGLFFDELWFMEGGVVNINGVEYRGVDENGNAYRWVPDILLNQQRKLRRLGSKKNYNVFLTQSCKTASEAFMVSEGNVFPTGEIYERLTTVRMNTSGIAPFMKGLLVEVEKGVKFKPDLENDLQPMDYFPLRGNETMRELKGCVMQYYAPQKIQGEVPDGAYIIGLDPYAVEGSVKISKGTSLGCAYVMRTRKYWKEMGQPEVICAAYIGREERSDDFLYNVYKLAKYYNAKIFFENDRGNVKQYFQKKKALHYLAETPGNVIEKHLSSTSTTLSRRYGYSMSNLKFKEDAIQYVIDWVLEERVEGEGTRNLDMIIDIALLEEMIRFNFDGGNFDRVMALVGCILGLEEYKIVDRQVRKDQSTFWTSNRKLFNIQKLTYEGRTTQNFAKRQAQEQSRVGSEIPRFHLPNIPW